MTFIFLHEIINEEENIKENLMSNLFNKKAVKNIISKKDNAIAIIKAKVSCDQGSRIS